MKKKDEIKINFVSICFVDGDFITKHNPMYALNNWMHAKAKIGNS